MVPEGVACLLGGMGTPLPSPWDLSGDTEARSVPNCSEIQERLAHDPQSRLLEDSFSAAIHWVRWGPARVLGRKVIGLQMVVVGRNARNARKALRTRRDALRRGVVKQPDRARPREARWHRLSRQPLTTGPSSLYRLSDKGSHFVNMNRCHHFVNASRCINSSIARWRWSCPCASPPVSLKEYIADLTACVAQRPWVSASSRSSGTC